MRELKKCWNGQEGRRSFHYRLDLVEGKLHFQVVFPAGVTGHPEAVPGAFTPELWKWDVGEFFLTGETGKYVEVNLSPSGAWWMAGFTAVRTPDREFRVSDFRVESRPQEVRVSLSLDSLQEYLGKEESWRGNVTGILNSPDYELLSVTDLSGEEADFHQPNSFLPIRSLLTS